ncbi:hypothetical protein UY3_02196 [Chelonia mydas]|uniref:Uncharacterized protein n=1 Tax=Chelonia mydas TaxID=8469 RepID=M7BRS0_CHEMY|nr:hypothetical protein UY3_02196 [Chelonia mydas]
MPLNEEQRGSRCQQGERRMGRHRQRVLCMNGVNSQSEQQEALPWHRYPELFRVSLADTQLEGLLFLLRHQADLLPLDDVAPSQRA